MTNYPNMSYCMCSNTLLAMQQILGAMEADGPAFIKEMGSGELEAFRELFNVCEDFLNRSEELEDMVESAE